MTKLSKDFDVSRNPSDYEITAHLRRRVDERVMVDFDIIAEAIEDGELIEITENQDEGDSRHNAVIHYDWCFSSFEVVVGVEDRKVQTAVEIES